MLYERLHIDFQHKDENGCLTQLVHDGYSQVNVLYSKQGCVRGNHYHKVSREAFFIISGSVEVTFSRDGREDRGKFTSGDFFMILPYTLHLMEFPEDCVMVAMYDIPVEQEDGTKDIFRKDE